MPRTDLEFRALEWTRPTVRFDPETSRKLELLRKATGQKVSELLSTLIDEAFRKATRGVKKATLGLDG